GIALPIVWGLASLLMSQPVLMVQIGGVMTGIFLLAVLVATWYLRRTETDPRLHGGTAATTLLVLSTIAIGILGVYTMLSTLGIFVIGARAAASVAACLQSARHALGNAAIE